MTYRVTKLDILNGSPSEPALCPVARAIKRRHPGAGVVVRSQYADIALKEVRLPERIQAWIRSYDTGGEVRPIMWEM